MAPPPGGNRQGRTNGTLGSGGAAPRVVSTDATHLEVRVLPTTGTVRVDDLQWVDPTAMVAWLVPALSLSLPGLLIVLIVLIQAGFATAFVPVTRQMLGGGRRRNAREHSRHKPMAG